MPTLYYLVSALDGPDKDRLVHPYLPYALNHLDILWRITSNWPEGDPRPQYVGQQYVLLVTFHCSTIFGCIVGNIFHLRQKLSIFLVTHQTIGCLSLFQQLDKHVTAHRAAQDGLMEPLPVLRRQILKALQEGRPVPS